jgi:hypothetical protein
LEPNHSSDKFNQNFSGSKLLTNQASDEYANMGNNFYSNANKVSQPAASMVRPAGESSSEDGPTIEELKGEN